MARKNKGATMNKPKWRIVEIRRNFGLMPNHKAHIILSDGRKIEHSDYSCRHVFFVDGYCVKVGQSQCQEEAAVWAKLSNYDKRYFAKFIAVFYADGYWVSIQKHIEGFIERGDLEDEYPYKLRYIDELAEKLSRKYNLDDVDDNYRNYGIDKDGKFKIVDYGISSDV